MNKLNVKKIVKAVIKKRFNFSNKIFNISMFTIDLWDSLAHLKLINDLEKKFKIKISPIEASKIISEKKIVSLINKKIKN